MEVLAQLTPHRLLEFVSLLLMFSPVAWQQDLEPPSFAELPPQMVEFSNVTGTRIPCSVNSGPFPANISWLAADLSPLKPIPGLREVLFDGTLMLPSFKAEYFRQDVHSTSYKCVITNAVGTVISNDVTVKAVVRQPYDVYVYDVFIMRGSTAVFKCHVPKIISSYVTVTSWIKDSGELISDVGFKKNSRYYIIPSGELYIKEVIAADGQSNFKCRVTNKLTGESKTSITSGKLFVTDPQGNVSPKITFSKKVIVAKEGEDILLPCEAQGYPVPNISWSQNTDMNQQESLPIKDGTLLVSGSLLMMESSHSAAGSYLCTASNSAGSAKTEVQLIINVPLEVVIDPEKLTVDAGKSALLTCNIRGNPVTSITWVKDGQLLSTLPEIEMKSNATIHIKSVTSDHKGIYQCLVKNAYQEAFAIATLKLGDSAPVLLSSFEERVVNPGSTVDLRCSFTGSPLPVVNWFLNGQTVSSRAIVKESVNAENNIESMLILRPVEVEDAGAYSCHASNKAGTIGHTARANVYGKLGSQKRTKIAVVSGKSVFLNCPFYGYPFDKIKWEKGGRPLPSDFNQKVMPDNSLHVRDVHRVDDSGIYFCTVQHAGQSVQGEVELTVMVPPKLAPFSFQDELVREGMRGRIQCVVLEGDLPITLKWLKDNQSIDPLLGVMIRDIDEFSSILTISSITPRHNGNYTCLAKNPAATVTYTTSLAVNGNPLFKYFSVPPKILPFAFQDDQFFKGMRAHIICAVSQGDLPLQFHWLKDGHPINPSLGVVTRSYDGHANSLSIESVSSGHTGNYTCVVNNTASTTTHTAQLLVYVAPKIIPFSFQESGVNEGVLARVSCVVYQGDLPIQINWFKDGKSVSSAYGLVVRRIDDYSSILTIESSKTEHAGNYSCVAKNAASSASHSSQLKVNVPPKIAPFSFQDDQLIEGMLIRVSCVVSRGDLPITITWLKDGQPIPNELHVATRIFDEYSSVLSIDPVSQRHNGNYTCIARNHAATATQTAQLNVQVPPKWVVEPTDITTNSRQTVYLHCKAEGLPEPVISWMWAKDDRSELSPINSNANNLVLRNGSVMLKKVTKDSEGFYFCSASNGVGRGLGKSMVLHVLAPPVFREKETQLAGKKGGNMSLICSAFGDQPITFMWSMDKNVLINPKKDSRYAIKNFNVDQQSARSELIITWLDRKDSGAYTCQAENEYGKDEMKINVIIQEFPDPPLLVSAKEGNRSVYLLWNLPFDGNSPVTKFVVQYKKQVDNWNTRMMNITVPSGSNSFTVSGLLPATTYDFRVAAENIIGISKLSSSVASTTEEDIPTGVALNVEVESTDQHTLRVTWKPPRKNHWNGAIRGYEIGYKIDGSENAYLFRNLEVPEDYTEDLIYQLTDLSMFTQYSVVVQAYNSKGKGPFSEPVVAMTSEDVPSNPPQGIRCSALSSRSIYILWEQPPPESLNGIVRGYKVMYKPVTEWYDSAVRIMTSPTTKITLQELEVNTNYTIQVLAFTKVGDGVKSAPVFCKTHEDVPESPPEIKVLPSSSDSVVVAWKSPKNSNGGITKYSVYYKPLEQGQELNAASDGNDDVALMTEQVNPEANSHTSRPDNQFLEVKGLKKNKKYAFWVTASSVIGEGPTSKIMAQTVADSKVPAKSASFDGTIKTPWKRDVVLPCKAVGVPTPQRKWMIGTKPLEVVGRNILLSDGTLLINKVSSEDSGNYTCTIYNEHGKDDVKYNLVVQVPPAAPLVDIVSKHRSSIQLQWKAGPDGGEKVKGYILHFRTESGTWETKELNPENHFYTLDGLACGSTYQIYLEAFNSIGTGPPCDVITVATEGTELSSPSKDSLFREGSTYVTIHLEAWPSTGCPIERFHVEYRPLKTIDWTLVSDSVRSSQKKLVIPGLNPSTWYALRLTAETNGKSNVAEYKFATLTLTGGTIPPPEIRIEHNPEPVYLFYLDPYIFIPSVALLIVVIIASVIICVCVKRKNGSMGSPSDSDTTINTWSRSMHPGSQYPTMAHRGSKDINPYATARLPDCILQHPCSDAFLGNSVPLDWAGTMGRHPTHPAQGMPSCQRGFQPELMQQAVNDSNLMNMQETTFVFPASNQTRFTQKKGKPRPDEDYDQPPVGI